MVCVILSQFINKLLMKFWLADQFQHQTVRFRIDVCQCLHKMYSRILSLPLQSLKSDMSPKIEYASIDSLCLFNEFVYTMCLSFNNVYSSNFVPLALWQSKRPDTITHHTFTLYVYTHLPFGLTLYQPVQYLCVYALFSTYICTTTQRQSTTHQPRLANRPCPANSYISSRNSEI